MSAPAPKRENLILNLIFNIALPTLILTKFSGEKSFGTVWGLVIALALPTVVYIVGVVLVPGYIQSFIVKPNEMDRESPFISHNLEWTRRGFGLEQIELREFEAETSIAGLDLQILLAVAGLCPDGIKLRRPSHFHLRCHTPPRSDRPAKRSNTPHGTRRSKDAAGGSPAYTWICTRRWLCRKTSFQWW